MTPPPASSAGHAWTFLQFDFAVDPPDVSRIPASDVLGVTVIMVQAWYKNKEFLRVGYYVKVQYADEKLRVSSCVRID